MNKSLLILLGFYVCIARSPLDQHQFNQPEQGNGHVAWGLSLYDLTLAAVNECETEHGANQCELVCFFSRMGG